MPWSKVQPERVEAFRTALLRAPEVTMKKMSGCEASHLNGEKFCHALEETMIVRLDEFRRAAAAR
ncbi:MAG: hypothetical protein FJW30_00985 [Acidobacteria bacterium]|nr:hypothetical protein [Acidobacteriota bacterium]